MEYNDTMSTQSLAALIKQDANPFMGLGDSSSSVNNDHRIKKETVTSGPDNRKKKRNFTDINDKSRRRKCCYCRKRFDSKSFLDKHILTHKKGKCNNCKSCDKRFTTKEHLKAHSGSKRRCKSHISNIPRNTHIADEPFEIHTRYKPSEPHTGFTHTRDMPSKTHTTVRPDKIHTGDQYCKTRTLGKPGKCHARKRRFKSVPGHEPDKTITGYMADNTHTHDKGVKTHTRVKPGKTNSGYMPYKNHTKMNTCNMFNSPTQKHYKTEDEQYKNNLDNRYECHTSVKHLTSGFQRKQHSMANQGEKYKKCDFNKKHVSCMVLPQGWTRISTFYCAFCTERFPTEGQLKHHSFTHTDVLSPTNVKKENPFRRRKLHRQHFTNLTEHLIHKHKAHSVVKQRLEGCKNSKIIKAPKINGFTKIRKEDRLLKNKQKFTKGKELIPKKYFKRSKVVCSLCHGTYLYKYFKVHWKRCPGAKAYVRETECMDMEGESSVVEDRTDILAALMTPPRIIERGQAFDNTVIVINEDDSEELPVQVKSSSELMEATPKDYGKQTKRFIAKFKQLFKTPEGKTRDLQYKSVTVSDRHKLNPFVKLERLQECTLCDKMFASKDQLQTHVNTHTVDKRGKRFGNTASCRKETPTTNQPHRPCIYCKHSFLNLTQHLSSQHKNEAEVKQLLEKIKSGNITKKQKREEFAKIRKRGMFMKNVENLSKGKELIPQRRSAGIKIVCASCHGTYSRACFGSHQLRCLSAKPFLPDPTSISTAEQDLNVSDNAKSDIVSDINSLEINKEFPTNILDDNSDNLTYGTIQSFTDASLENMGTYVVDNLTEFVDSTNTCMTSEYITMDSSTGGGAIYLSTSSGAEEQYTNIVYTAKTDNSEFRLSNSCERPTPFTQNEAMCSVTDNDISQSCVIENGSSYFPENAMQCEDEMNRGFVSLYTERNLFTDSSKVLDRTDSGFSSQHTSFDHSDDSAVDSTPPILSAGFENGENSVFTFTNIRGDYSTESTNNSNAYVVLEQINSGLPQDQLQNGDNSNTYIVLEHVLPDSLDKVGA